MLDALAHDCQRGSFDGVYDRFIGGSVRAYQSLLQSGNIRAVRTGKFGIKTLEKLRKDNSRISSCTEQHSLRDAFQVCSERFARFGVFQPVFERHSHIRARIPVRNGEYVEHIYFFFPRFKFRQPVSEHSAEMNAVDCFCLHNDHLPSPFLCFFPISTSDLGSIYVKTKDSNVPAALTAVIKYIGLTEEVSEMLPAAALRAFRTT